MKMEEKRSDIMVKSCEFSGLKKVDPKDNPFGLRPEQLGDKPYNAVDITLVIVNRSQDEKQINLYTISKPDVPNSAQTSWGQNYTIGAQEEKTIKYTIPMFGMSASDYKDYTGPIRYLVRILGSEGPVPDEKGERRFFEKTKYFDVPAEEPPDELEDKFIDLEECLSGLEKTSVLQDVHIEGNPCRAIESLTAKLFNFGANTQYLGIDVAAFTDRGCYQTQFFYELRPGEELPVDLGKMITGHPTRHLRIRLVIMPKYIFNSPRARGEFLWRSYKEEKYGTLVSKLDYYFG